MDKRAQELYTTTFFWEALAVLPRCVVALPVAYLLLTPLLLVWLGGVGTGYEEVYFVLIGVLALALAAAPLGLSLLALGGQSGGYRLTKTAIDGREPEPEELAVLQSAFAQLGVPRPAYLFVIEAVTPEAYVIGDAIYVTRALLDSEFLVPVLAHELGHLAQGDGRLILALRRFQLPFLGWFRTLGTASMAGGLQSRNPTVAAIAASTGCLFWVLALAGGGIGLAVTRFAWPSYWREREFSADHHACRLGQGHELIEALRRFEFFDVAVPFHHFVSDHPHVRQRIGRLQRLIETGECEPAELTGKPRDHPAEDPLPAATRTERTVPRQEPFSGTLTPEQKRQSRESRRGFTHAESVLDLVFLDEDQVGSADHEQIAAEKDWIRANGRRIVDLAHFGTFTAGSCAIWIFWIPEAAEQYGNDAFHYITREAHSELMEDPDSRIAGDISLALAAKWMQTVATHDGSREVIIVILSLQGFSGKFNLHHYLAGMRGGGPLPAWGEEPPGRR